jgi:hypothetical protein
MPIVGPPAKADILKIKQGNRRLAKRLTRKVNGLLDKPLDEIEELIPDPPGIGPRYMVDLVDGYVVVYWILSPPDELRGARAALWVERVILRKILEEAFAARAPQD